MEGICENDRIDGHRLSKMRTEYVTWGPLEQRRREKSEFFDLSSLRAMS